MEKTQKALHPPIRLFVKKLSRNIFWGMGIISICLFIGMLGYRYFENMSWTDAFVNASMILSGMGPVGALNTQGGKIFAGLYAIFSGVVFLVMIAIVFAPVIHRFFHQFHMEDKDK